MLTYAPSAHPSTFILNNKRFSLENLIININKSQCMQDIEAAFVGVDSVFKYWIGSVLDCRCFGVVLLCKCYIFQITCCHFKMDSSVDFLLNPVLYIRSENAWT